MPTTNILSYLLLTLLAISLMPQVQTRADDLLANALPASNTKDVRNAVQSAVPYLKKDGVGWMEKRGCVSCHQVPSMLWSLSAAHDRGFDVDNSELEAWRAWSVDVVNFVKPEQKKGVDRSKTMSGNIDTMAALMLAIPDSEAEGKWRNVFSQSLIDNQQDDGSWNACGQLPLQKRPKPETTRATTAWTFLALARFADSVDAKPNQSALSIIDAEPKAKSTEWWAVRGLLADQLDDQDRLTQVQATLLKLQNEDGGWGWISDQKSDALATGLAMYSLQRTSTDDSFKTNIQQATEFLISTQEDNGSWSVPGTKASAKGKSTATSNYWGTAWAVIGLLESHADARIVAK